MHKTKENKFAIILSNVDAMKIYNLYKWHTPLEILIEFVIA